MLKVAVESGEDRVLGIGDLVELVRGWLESQLLRRRRIRG